MAAFVRWLTGLARPSRDPRGNGATGDRPRRLQKFGTSSTPSHRYYTALIFVVVDQGVAVVQWPLWPTSYQVTKCR